MRAVLWAAVSSDEQIGPKKPSIDLQLEECEKRANEQGMTIVERLVVNGHSRDLMPNEALELIPEYRRLKALVEAQAMDVIICRDTSRIGRSRTLAAWASEFPARYGVQLWDVSNGNAPVSKDDFLEKKGTAPLLHAVNEGVAAQRNTDAVSKWWGTMKKKVGQGRHCSKIPYGYSLDKNTGIVSVDPEQAEIVLWAFQEFAAGRSLTSLSKEFKQRAIVLAVSRGNEPPLYERQRREARGEKNPPTKRPQKNPWAGAFPNSNIALGHMLRRRFFIGEVHLTLPDGHSEGVIRCRDGEHPAIVPVDLFMVAQQRLDEMEAHKHPHPSRRYPLSGIVRCGYCDGVMHVHSKGTGADSKYLICHRPGCSWNGKRYSVIEFLVMHTLLQVPEARDDILAKLPLGQDDERDRVRVETENCQTEVRQLENRVDRWAEGFASGAFTAEYVRERWARDEEALAQKRTELAALEDRLAGLPTPEQARADVEDFVEHRAAALATRLRTRERVEAARIRRELERAEVMVSVYRQGVTMAVLNVPLDVLSLGA